MSLSIDQLRDYGFCGLYYRYRHDLNFPYLPLSSYEVFSDGLHEAVNAMLRDWGLRRKVFRRVMADAAKLFVSLIDSASHLALQDPKKLIELRAQGLLVIGNMTNLIDVTKDLVAVTQFEHEVEISPGEAIADEVDAIVIKNDVDRSKRYYMLVSILEDVTQKSTSSRFDDLHLGFARHAMLEHFEPRLDRPIVHQYISLRNTNLRPVITSAKDINTFKILSGKLIEGIRRRIFLPTAHVSKCRSCWFNKICENSFAADQLPTAQVNRARKALEIAKVEALR